MKRRDILKAVPSVSLAGLAAVGATRLDAGAETPVMQAYRQWETYRQWLRGPETNGLPARDYDKLVEHQSELACDILDMPAEAPVDFIAKVIAYTYYGENALPDHDDMPGLWAEARRLVG